MTIPLKYSVGFDCSKDDFKACISLINTEQKVIVKASRAFNNTVKGFNDAETWVLKNRKEKISVVVVMEATGNYYENLAFFFHQKGYYVSIVLPNKSKKYMESRGIKTKNDPVDARGLSQMGAEQLLKKWEPFTKEIYQLRLLTRQCERLATYRTQLINQVKSLDAGMYQNEKVKRQIQDMLALAEDQIKEAKAQIEAFVDADSKLKEKVDKILLVKGLGILTIVTVIAETNGFELFMNQKQLTSFAGYDVIENQSGKRVGKTRISKKGNSHIRRAMHMAALGAVRWGEPRFVNLYERVFERTKIKMKGYTAVQRKLLCLIYTLWKKNEAYDASFNQTSGNDEPKFLFPLDFEKVGKKVALISNTKATQDELPCKESPEVLFPLLQIY